MNKEQFELKETEQYKETKHSAFIITVYFLMQIEFTTPVLLNMFRKCTMYC